MYDITIDGCECSCRAFNVIDKSFPWGIFIFFIFMLIVGGVLYYYWRKNKKSTDKYLQIKVGKQ